MTTSPTILILAAYDQTAKTLRYDPTTKTITHPIHKPRTKHSAQELITDIRQMADALEEYLEGVGG